MRKSIALLASCMLVCSITACGKGDNEESKSKEVAVSSESGENRDNQEDKESDETTTEEETTEKKTKKEEFEEVKFILTFKNLRKNVLIQLLWISMECQKRISICIKTNLNLMN